MTIEEQEKRDCPSRCINPDCGGRNIHPHRIISDPFDQPHVCGWQCILCGWVMEKQLRKYVHVATDRIILAPGALRLLRRGRAGR